MTTFRTYSELMTFDTFEERYEYLRLDSKVGVETFGWDRVFNQRLYHSPEWKRFKNGIIIRDDGCDLGMDGHEIQKGTRIYIHHINPISLRDIEYQTDLLMDPENAITTILSTHNAIHYGDKGLLISDPIERSRNDTCPWRH